MRYHLHKILRRLPLYYLVFLNSQSLLCLLQLLLFFKKFFHFQKKINLIRFIQILELNDILFAFSVNSILILISIINIALRYYSLIHSLHSYLLSLVILLLICLAQGTLVNLINQKNCSLDPE